jgi:hypothetical protein
VFCCPLDRLIYNLRYIVNIKFINKSIKIAESCRESEIFVFSLISGFRQTLKFEIFSVMGYNAAQTGSYIPTFPKNLTALLSKVGRIFYSENRVNCYQSSFRNVSEKRREQYT